MEALLKLMSSSVIQGWILSAALSAVAYGATRALGAIAASKGSDKWKALETSAIQTVQDILDAEAKASSGKAPTAADIPRLSAVAMQVFRTHEDGLSASSEAWIKGIIEARLAVKTGTHPAFLAAKVAAGAAVAPDKGFASMRLMFVVAALGAALLSSCAATWSHPVLSYGASLPLVEVMPNQAHPVAFSPGAGVMGSLGLGQVAIAGQSYDLLDLGADFFGNVIPGANGSPSGSAQVALTVGSLNNLVFLGAATPLTGGPGGGDFGGAFQVYPLLGGSIPFDFGPTTPPAGIPSAGAQMFPRGGTLHFP